ncbi:hypothetical protein L9F63_012311, partial [Diploptera punctata]
NLDTRIIYFVTYFISLLIQENSSDPFFHFPQLSYSVDMEQIPGDLRVYNIHNSASLLVQVI